MADRLTASPGTCPVSFPATHKPGVRGGPFLFNARHWGVPSLQLEAWRIKGTASGGSFGTWLDAASNTRFATITNGVYTTGGQNGYPYVVFNGTSTVGTYQSFTLTGAFTIVSVTKMNGTPVNDPLFGDVASTAYLWRFKDATTAQLDTGAASVISFTHATRGTTSVRIDIVRRDSANLCQHWLDGTESTGSGTHASSMVVNQIGKVESLTNFLNANVYALYIWPIAIGSVVQLNDSLAHQYDL